MTEVKDNSNNDIQGLDEVLEEIGLLDEHFIDACYILSIERNIPVVLEAIAKRLHSDKSEEIDNVFKIHVVKFTQMLIAYRASSGKGPNPTMGTPESGQLFRFILSFSKKFNIAI